jgi:hypothetical protein
MGTLVFETLTNLMIYVFGVTFITTLLLGFSTRIFLKSIAFNPCIYVPTGFIGIVIHELSHLILALFFRHDIESVSLFNLNRDDLSGFVVSSYNRQSFYQKLGLYFVGVGPTILGFWIIYLILKYIHPNETAQLIQYSSLNVGSSDILEALSNNFTIMMSIDYQINIMNLIAYMMILSIALYASLSLKDIIAAIKGIPYVLMMLVGFSFVYHIVFKGPQDLIDQLVITTSYMQISIVLMLFVIIGCLSVLLLMTRYFVGLIRS